jgi:hypothetical protein
VTDHKWHVFYADGRELTFDAAGCEACTGALLGIDGNGENAALDEQPLVGDEVLHHAIDSVLIPGGHRVDLARPGRPRLVPAAPGLNIESTRSATEEQGGRRPGGPVRATGCHWRTTSLQ